MRFSLYLIVFSDFKSFMIFFHSPSMQFWNCLSTFFKSFSKKMLIALIEVFISINNPQHVLFKNILFYDNTNWNKSGDIWTPRFFCFRNFRIIKMRTNNFKIALMVNERISWTIWNQKRRLNTKKNALMMRLWIYSKILLSTWKNLSSVNLQNLIIHHK